MGLALNVVFYVVHNEIKQICLTQAPKQGVYSQIFSRGSSERIKGQIKRWIEAYAEGKKMSIDLPLSLDGMPDFTKNTLLMLLKIPFGKTVSYQHLAHVLGTMKGARAVGNACGRNPFPLIIPCHRVIASDGSLGGFSQGLTIKQQLLSFEGAND